MQRRLRSRDGSKGSKPSLSRKGGWENVPSRHQRRESATKPSRFGGTNSTSTAAATAGVQMRRDTPAAQGSTMARAGWLLSVLLVAVATAAAEETTAQPAATDDQASAPKVALPGSTGIVPAGKGSVAAGRIEVARPPERGAAAATEDLPTWLGELLGLKQPPSPRETEKKQANRHLTVIPFLSSSPVTGLGFGVAAAGTTQRGEPENTSLPTYSTSFTVTTQSQYAPTARHALRFAGDDWGLTGMW